MVTAKPTPCANVGGRGSSSSSGGERRGRTKRANTRPNGLRRTPANALHAKTALTTARSTQAARSAPPKPSTTIDEQQERGDAPP